MDAVELVETPDEALTLLQGKQPPLVALYPSDQLGQGDTGWFVGANAACKDKGVADIILHGFNSEGDEIYVWPEHPLVDFPQVFLTRSVSRSEPEGSKPTLLAFQAQLTTIFQSQT